MPETPAEALAETSNGSTGDMDPPGGMTPARAADYWTKQIAIAEREQRPYWSEATNLIEAYRNGRHTSAGAHPRKRFNVLYGNVETLRGAIYGRPGKPDCRPRWSTADPIARSASEVMERGLAVGMDNRSHETALEAGVLLGCLTGRAVHRFDIESQVGEMPGPDGQPMKAVTKQRISKRIIANQNWLHSPSECWDEVWWMAFRHKMTRGDMKQAGFTGWDQVALNWMPTAGDGKPLEAADDDVKRAEVFEVWSKVHMARFWIVKDHDRALKIEEDPLGLEGFWPMQEPLTLHPHIGGSLLPQLDWWQYSKLADDLEEANNRISALTKQLKYRGVYDKSIADLKKLSKAADNTFVGVENMGLMAQKGGLNKAFEVLSIKELAETLLQVMQLAEQLEAKIDKMTGIADIMRGDGGEKRVTATEQNIKAQYGGIRLKTRQRSVQAWIRDGMRIEAELMCEHFEPDILQQITGIEVPDELLEFLRQDRLRSMRVDIETDSTIFEDAEEQKKANAEIMASALPLLQQAIVAMQQAPPMAEVIFEMLAMTLRSMKGGRQIEEVIDRARQQMMQAMEQQQSAEPPPDPEQVKAEAAMAMEQQRAEATAESDRQKAAVTLQVEKLKLEAQAAAEAARLDFEREKWMDELELKRDELEARRMEAEAKIAEGQMKLEMEDAHRRADREQADWQHEASRDDAERARDQEADEAERDRVATKDAKAPKEDA